MIRREDPPGLQPYDIDAILEFLPIFERRDFRAYDGINDGYYRWHKDVERFHSALYDHNWVIGFDWPEWQSEAEDIIRDHAKLDSADVETLRKLLTTIARKERFCANVFPIACEDGTMMRILRRLHKCTEQGEEVAQ